MKSTESTALLPRQVLPITAPEQKPIKPTVIQRNKSSKQPEVKGRIKITDAADMGRQQRSTTTTTIPVNPQSHHIRTKQPKKKKKESNFARDEYSILEEKLISSIQINEALENDVNRKITLAYQQQTLRIPMMAFMRYENGIRFVKDLAHFQREYDTEWTKNPTIISKKQLSLDLLHHEEEYRVIVSLILYLENLEPSLVYIISRYPVIVTPKVPDLFLGDVEATTTTTTVTTMSRTVTTTTTHGGGGSVVTTPTFIERLYMNCVRVTQPGYYYHIYVDLSLTKPEPIAD